MVAYLTLLCSIFGLVSTETQSFSQISDQLVLLIKERNRNETYGHNIYLSRKVYDFDILDKIFKKLHENPELTNSFINVEVQYKIEKRILQMPTKYLLQIHFMDERAMVCSNKNMQYLN